MIRLALPLAALFALTACSGYEDDTQVDAVSKSEAEALDEAAAMIDERRLPDDAVAAQDHEKGNGEPEAAPQ